MDTVFSRFYGLDRFPCKTDEGLSDLVKQKKVLPIGDRLFFNAEVYQKRIRVTAETFLIEANQRGRTWQKGVHVFVVGLGLGVWRISALQVIIHFNYSLSRWLKTGKV